MKTRGWVRNTLTALVVALFFIAPIGVVVQDLSVKNQLRAAARHDSARLVCNKLNETNANIQLFVLGLATAPGSKVTPDESIRLKVALNARFPQTDCSKL